MKIIKADDSKYLSLILGPKDFDAKGTVKGFSLLRDMSEFYEKQILNSFKGRLCARKGLVLSEVSSNFMAFNRSATNKLFVLAKIRRDAYSFWYVTVKVSHADMRWHGKISLTYIERT